MLMEGVAEADDLFQMCRLHRHYLSDRETAFMITDIHFDKYFLKSVVAGAYSYH